MTKGKVRGLMEFFLSGFPNREYAWALFNQGIPETKRTDATLSWDVITRDYLKVIEDTVDHMEKAEDVAHRFSKAGNKLIFEPPDGVDDRDRRKSDYRRDRQHETEALQAVGQWDWEDPDGVSVGDHVSQDDPDWDYDQEIEEYDNDVAYETAEEDEYEDQHRRTSVNHQYQDQDTGEESEVDSEHVQDVPKKEQYLTAIVGKDGRTLVCYDFAKLGKCKYQDKPGGCKYSHAAEDVQRFKAAELLGPVNFQPRTPRFTGGQQRSGGYPPRRTSNNAVYTPGPKGTSGGIRAPFRHPTPSRDRRSERGRR